MSGAPTSMSRAWLCVGLLWLVALLNYLDRIMLTTMRSSIVAAIPMSDAQFGLLTSMFLWVYAALSPFAGFAADRLGRSPVIIGSLLIWSAVTWLTGHSKTFEQLLCARALMGASEAFYIPAGMALIMDYHRGQTRSLANGVHVSGTMVGYGLGGIGGWLADRHPWNYAFNLFGLVGIAYAGLLIFALRDAPREAVDRASSADKPGFLPALKSLCSRGSFLLAILFWGLLGLVGWGIAGWMPTYLKEHFNMGQGAAGFSATAYLQGAALFGVILGGMLTDRFSRGAEHRRISITALALLIAVPGVLAAATANILWIAIGGLMLYGLTRSSADANMMPILCLISDPRYRATGYGVLNFFSALVGGVTIYAGGAMRDAKIDLTHFFVAAAVCLALCAGLLAIVKPTPRTEP